MEITKVIVDEITHQGDDLSPAYRKATLFEMNGRSWIGTPSERPSTEYIGPFVRISANGEDPKIEVLNEGIVKPKAILPIEYRKEWKTSGDIAYALLIPEKFVATELKLTTSDNKVRYPECSSTADHRLLYYATFSDPDFVTTALIVRDEVLWSRVIAGKVKAPHQITKKNELIGKVVKEGIPFALKTIITCWIRNGVDTPLAK